MTEPSTGQLLSFMMIGWQELLILACPLFMVGIVVGIVFLVLFLTGVIGGKKKP